MKFFGVLAIMLASAAAMPKALPTTPTVMRPRSAEKVAAPALSSALQIRGGGLVTKELFIQTVRVATRCVWWRTEAWPADARQAVLAEPAAAADLRRSRGRRTRRPAQTLRNDHDPRHAAPAEPRSTKLTAHPRRATQMSIANMGFGAQVSSRATPPHAAACRRMPPPLETAP